MANPSSKAKTSKTSKKSATNHESTRVSKYPASRIAGLKPFNSETAKEAQKKSTLSKLKIAERRREIRDSFANSAPEDLCKEFWKAARAGNKDVCDCIKLGLSIFGGTFDQSEERVQNFKVNQNTQEKRSVVINFRKATPEDAK